MEKEEIEKAKERGVYMNIPESYKEMKKVKEYPSYVLYEDKNGFKECISYYDLGYRTPQVDDRRVFVNSHF